MREHLIAIREGIAAGRYVNEAAVSHGIVLRILHGLSWPAYDVDVVAPEFSVEGRRVDYALCHPRGKPLVFIEVKKVGQGEGADRQLFEYAFHRGVPMAILTDGQEWHFFLPGEQGDYGERRVYKLDLLERDIDESIDRLHRYLDYRRICSGEAIDAARGDYRDVTKGRQIQAALPEAWKKLVEEADELLLELVADKVESICGYKPEPDTVAAFLAGGVARTPVLPRTAPIPTPPQRPTVPGRQAVPAAPQSVGFVFLGQARPARNGRDVLIQVLQEMAARDPSFLERFAALPKHGQRVRYVARNRNELNPARPDLAEISREFVPGWWVYLNLSYEAMSKVIQLACQVASLQFGTDVSINLGDAAPPSPTKSGRAMMKAQG